jgi:hypothetical protein
MKLVEVWDEPSIVPDMEMYLGISTVVLPSGSSDDVVKIGDYCYGYRGYLMVLVSRGNSVVDGRPIYSADMYKAGHNKPFDRLVGPMYDFKAIDGFRRYVDIGNAEYYAATNL